MGQSGRQCECGCPLAECLVMSAVGVRPRALGAARSVCQEVAGRQSRRLSVARIAAVSAMGTTQPHQAMAVAGGFPKSHAARHIGPQLILGVQLWLLTSCAVETSAVQHP